MTTCTPKPQWWCYVKSWVDRGTWCTCGCLEWDVLKAPAQTGDAEMMEFEEEYRKRDDHDGALCPAVQNPRNQCITTEMVNRQEYIAKAFVKNMCANIPGV